MSWILGVVVYAAIVVALCPIYGRLRIGTNPGDAFGAAIFWPLSIPYLMVRAGWNHESRNGLTEAEIARLDAVLEGKEEL